MTSCSVYNWGSWPGGGGIAAWERAEHQVPGGEQLHCASLSLYVLLLVSWFNASQQLSTSQLLPPTPSQWDGEEDRGGGEE